jgi:hypothetical protein
MELFQEGNNAIPAIYISVCTTGKVNQRFSHKASLTTKIQS